MTKEKYDLILETSETLINKYLKHTYETNTLNKSYKGKYKIELPKIIKHSEYIEYEIILKEPLRIDALNDENIKVYFSADIKLSFNYFMMEATIIGFIESKPNYDRGKTQLELNTQKIHLDKILLDDSVKVPPFILTTINDILKDIVRKGLEDLDNIPLPPIIGDLSLPDMPKGKEYLLPISFGEIVILNENNLALAFDIHTQSVGTKAPLKDHNLKDDLSITVSSSAVNKVLDFWWEKTTYNKKQSFTGRIRFQNVDELIDRLSNYSIELIPKLLTLGFIELDWDLIEVWMDYIAQVTVIQPKVILRDGFLSLEAMTVVDISAVLRADLDVSLDFDTSGPIPDVLTPWKDDRVIGEARRVLDVFRFYEKDKRVELVDAKANIVIGPEQRIRLDLESFDIDLGLNWRLPRRLIRRLEKNIEKHIMDAYPSLPLSPAIVRHQVENSNLSFELDIKSIKNMENMIEIAADINIT